MAKKGEFLQGTIDEQLALFKNAFPDEERMKEVETCPLVRICDAGLEEIEHL